MWPDSGRIRTFAGVNSNSGWLGGVADWAVSLIEALGAFGAGLAVAVENLFPPIPSEAILPLAGFAASRGDLDLIAAIVWTTVGSTVGALLLYLLGAWLGRARMRRLVVKIAGRHRRRRTC